MRWAWLPVAATLTTISAVTHANPCKPQAGVSPCVEADNLWPHAGGGPFLSLGSSTTTPAGGLSFGLVGSFLKQPVGVGVASADPAGSTVFLVDDRVDATLLFALGITDRLELTLAAPTTLYQSGSGLAGVVSNGPALPRSGVHDLRFGFALALLARPRSGEPQGPGLTARVEFGAPLGSREAFASAPSAVVAPSLVLDWRLGRVLVAAEASARVRREAAIGSAVVGTQIGGALGVAVDAIRDGWLTVGAEGFALPTIAAQGVDPRTGSARALAPGEWMASVSNTRLLGGDLGLTFGAGGPLPFSPHALTSPKYRIDFAIRYAPTGRDSDGDGVPDSVDRCPSQAGEGSDGCPRPAGREVIRDRDGDGIPDEVDQCPDQPEDFDGFQDDDGCPEPDNDGDKIPDVRDLCPNSPEDFDGFQDDDGCPDFDNDGDQIPDLVDLCPNEAEDFDGFEDDDGCPDLDNDQDGVPDLVDLCPNVPETINGVDDGDGCPEPGARSLVRWEGDRVWVEKPARFTAGKAAIPAALAKQVKMMAQLVRGRTPLGMVVIEAYPDRAGDASLRGAELATARAGALQKAFVEAGVPAGVITAVAGDPGVKRAEGAPAFDVTVRRKARGGRKIKQQGDTSQR